MTDAALAEVATGSQRLRASRSGPLQGAAQVPGDKSMSHRALILGGLAVGETVIRGLLESDDVMRTMAALRALGVPVSRSGGVWRVRGGAWREPSDPIDCGNSATTARLLIGAAAGFPIAARFDGDRSLRTRPMDRLVAPLAEMGAHIAGGEHLPLGVRGGGLRGIAHLNRYPSAQVKSAILLAGLNAAGEVAITEPLPSRDHTEIMLRQFAVDVEVTDDAGGRTVRLGPGRTPIAAEIGIPGDPSSAAFPLLAAALVPGSTVAAECVSLNPLRAGFYDVLGEMCAAISVSNGRLQSGEVVGDVAIAHAPLRPCRVTAERVPSMIDEIPALAIACAFAQGESVIHGLSELRHKESDRLAAIVGGLTQCGVAAIADGDSLRVFGRGRVRGGARVSSAGDHRIAMAFLVLGLGSDAPVEVDGAEFIATSFPGFADTMRGVGAQIEAR